MKPIPFNLKRAKAGDLILCDGKPARLIAHVPEAIYDDRVVVLRMDDKSVCSYSEDGKLCTTENIPSLTMAPKKRVVWVNMYPEPFSCDGHPTKDEAGYGARALRVACVRVEFEEGEGL